MSGKIIYFHIMGTLILLIVVAFAVWRIVLNYTRAVEREREEDITVPKMMAVPNDRVEPSSKLIIEGFYIYTDENGTKTLRDAEGQALLDFTVYRVVYDQGNHCLVCFLSGNRGIWFYYPEDQRKIFRAYSRLELKALNNQYHIYGHTNKLGIGILDNNYTELTRAKYTTIRMYDENYFLAKEYRGDVAVELLIDLKGTEILKNIQVIFSERPIDNTILVKDLQDQYFFFNLSDHSIIELPYKWIWRCGKVTGKELENNGAANLLRAMKETDEVFEGYDLKRLKGTILNQEGKALFPPKYDSIEFVAQEHLAHFKVGFGDEQLWDYLSEEDFENFDGSGFEPMLYGIIDASDQTIIPVEYTRISLLKEQFYKVNKGARLYFEVDYGGYAYDEPYWCWFQEGGEYGLYDLNGNLLLPVDYEDIYAVPEGSKGDIALVTADKVQFMNIKGSRLVPVD